jgi:hypothetical protein
MVFLIAQFFGDLNPDHIYSTDNSATPKLLPLLQGDILGNS